MHYMAGDEQSPGAVFIRIIDPNDFDRAQSAIVKLIETALPGWFNIQRYRMLGFEGSGVSKFLQNYIIMARTRRAAPSNSNVVMWKGNYLAEYPGSIGEDTELYFDSLMKARAAGKVSNTIFEPWDYEPTSTIEDITAGLAQTVAEAAGFAAPAISSGVNKVLITAAVVGVIYLLGKQYMVRKFV
jgi:hypothetical protein